MQHISHTGLVIHGLPETIDCDALKRMVCVYGKIRRINRIGTKGFVDFCAQDDARNCIRQLGNSTGYFPQWSNSRRK